MDNERPFGEGFDEDNDDFGGFEAADPVDPDSVNGAIAGVSAGPNPWAVMYPPVTGAMNVQPDLLCGQNRFPQHLDNPLTVDVAGSAEACVPPDYLNNDNGAARFLDGNGVDDDLELDLDNVNLANDILDGSFRSTGSNQASSGSTNHGPEQLPDISGLDLALGTAAGSINRPELVTNASAINRPELVTNASVVNRPELVNNVTSAMNSNSSTSQRNEVPSGRVGESVSGDDVDGSSNAGSISGANAISVGNQPVPQEPNVANDPEGAIGGKEVDSEAQNALENVKEENNSLKKKLEKLEDEHTQLVEDLAKSQTEAEAARHKLQELQHQHNAQLEEVRAAGHQSLTMVVAEYRELVATVAKEQQVAGEQRLVKRLREEGDKLKQILQTQKEEFVQMQAEERRKQEEEIAKALDAMRQKEQEQFDKQLAEERKRNEEALQTEIQKERETSAKAIERVIEEEKKKAQEMLEKEQENFRQQLAREVEKSREELRSAMREERDGHKVTMSAMLEEERAKSTESVQQAMQSTRADLHSFLQEQRQSERVVQRRHLASLDLFLESARHQLQLLMDPEHGTSASDRSTDHKPSDTDRNAETSS